MRDRQSEPAETGRSPPVRVFLCGVTSGVLWKRRVLNKSTATAIRRSGYYFTAARGWGETVRTAAWSGVFYYSRFVAGERGCVSAPSREQTRVHVRLEALTQPRSP